MAKQKVFNRSPEERKERQKVWAREFKDRNPRYSADLGHNWNIENGMYGPNSKAVLRPDPRKRSSKQ